MAEKKPADPRVANVVKQMARKLQGDIAEMGRLRNGPPPKTFPQFREIRNRHREIQGLMFSIQERPSSPISATPSSATRPSR